MKVLYIGGVKSGKSRLAEAHALKLSANPVYLATTEFIDEELGERIARHKAQRSAAFSLVEEPNHLVKAVERAESAVLVECVSMWLNNRLYHEASDAEILDEIMSVLQSDTDCVFVLNDVGSGIIPDNALARRFVDLSGLIAQKLAAACDEVYHVIAGIGTRIK